MHLNTHCISGYQTKSTKHLSKNILVHCEDILIAPLRTTSNMFIVWLPHLQRAAVPPKSPELSFAVLPFFVLFSKSPICQVKYGCADTTTVIILALYQIVAALIIQSISS